VQAALTSAATFAAGAALPLLVVFISPQSELIPAVLRCLIGFFSPRCAVGARLGGADVLRATTHVAFWGALAMAITAGGSRIFGTAM
jgi:VIT1/CCC1 family predicted Fe2+/Mn2+ transporter